MRARLWSTLLMLAVGTALPVTSCTNLGDIAVGACGNHVLDPGEDCDTFAAEAGTRCRAPSEGAGCHWACVRGDATAHCPAGLGCGVDGVCRRPTWEFKQTSDSPTELTRWLGVRDMDGDGRDDVVDSTSAAMRVLYFDENGGLAGRYVANWDVPVPALGHFTPDSLVDLGIPTGNLLAVLRAGSDRTLTPYSFPSLVSFPATMRPLLLEALPGVLAPPQPQLQGAQILFIVPIGANSFSVVPSTGYGSVSLAMGFQGAAADILTTPHGRLIANLYCEQVAFGLKDATQVQLGSPCKQNKDGTPVWNSLGANGSPPADAVLFAPVTLPASQKLKEGPFLADVDADGKLDLVVGTAEAVWVAYNADGRFHSAPGLAAAQPADNQFSILGKHPTVGTSSVADPILAAGDLTGDGKLDLVTAHSIRGGVPIAGGLKWTYLVPIAGEDSPQWTNAIIADLNGDKRPDLVAGGPTELLIDAFLGAPDGRLNRFRTATQGAPDRLQVGDFDGDLQLDVAVSRVVDASTSAIEILFGQPGRPLGDPVNIATFPTLLDMVAADAVVYRGHDGCTDLMALTQSSSDPTQHAAAFITGSSDRLILSPLSLYGITTPGPLLDATSANQAETTSFAAVTARINTDGHDNIALVARDEQTQKSYLVGLPFKGDGDGHLASRIISDALPPELDVTRTYLVARDLDGDGLDEVMALAPWTGAGAAGVLVTLTLKAGQWVQSAPLVLPDGTGINPPLVNKRSPRVELADVDGDGKLDLILLAFTQETSVAVPNGHAKVVVFRGAGAGFGSPVAINTPTDTRSLALLPGGTPTGAATHPYFAVVASSGSYVGTLDLETASLLKGSSLPDLIGPRRTVILGSGDFNGDGVTDLVVGSERSVTTFLGVAAP